VSSRDPQDVAAYEALLLETTVGPLEPLPDRITVCDYDPGWPARYDHEASRIKQVLGDRALRLEHVGSTSVPGLAAKPIIDIVLEVPDSADEPAYGGDLEAAGYVLRIREPEWLEHRMFRVPGRVHVHVFSRDCPETHRMVAFRDHLRRHTDDRDLYARTKRDLAARDWKYMQQYADAKTDVVSAIMTRAGRGRTS
jgi:GrpB-like predicted nucleotidyltransferase (UPF0157 family)